MGGKNIVVSHDFKLLVFHLIISTNLNYNLKLYKNNKSINSVFKQIINVHPHHHKQDYCSST